MGQLIDLSARRGMGPGAGQARRARVNRTRGAQSAPRTAFFFDLACPFSYLAAERVERNLGVVDWVPVSAAALLGGAPRESAVGGVRIAAELRAAELRAAELRLPLVWPERHPAAVPGALRAAAWAAESGAGSTFALTAARMAFCGGYDLDDPEVIGEAAAASGLAPDACRAAAADPRRDQGLHGTANGLGMHGVRALPVIRLAGRFRAAEAVFAERILAPPA